MKKKNYNYQEIDYMIHSLDLYSRILTGQYDKILSYYSLYENIHVHHNFNEEMKVKTAFLALRDLCMKNKTLKKHGFHASLGIWSPDTPLVAMRAYDIQQILRYQMAYHEYPEGGYTVNFNPPFIHGKWRIQEGTRVTLRHSLSQFKYPDYHVRNMLRPHWECPCIISKFNDKKEVVTVLYSDKVRKVIEDALFVQACLESFQLTEMFHFLYPEVDRTTIISYTQEIENILKSL